VFQIAYSHSALKGLRRLPANWRTRIAAKIAAVANDPHGPQPQVKSLAGRGDFRLRVGDWRILYRLDDATRTMTVLDILKRDEAYR
jgi:mRNA interferase RelE/StbE